MSNVIPHEYHEAVSIDALEPFPNNPNRGDVDLIQSSIESIGFYSVILAQKSTSRILAGHHRLEAARAAGITEVPVVYLDVTDDEALAIMVGDNGTNRKGVFDTQALLESLESLSGLGLLGAAGFNNDDIDGLMRELNTGEVDDTDAFPETIRSPLTITCPSCRHVFEQ